MAGVVPTNSCQPVIEGCSCIASLLYSFSLDMGSASFSSWRKPPGKMLQDSQLEAEPVCTVGRAPRAVTTHKFLYPSRTGEDSGNSQVFVIISLSLGHLYPGQKMATECRHGWSWCIHCKKTKESKINSAWDH